MATASKCCQDQYVSVITARSHSDTSSGDSVRSRGDAENPSLPANFEFLGNLIGAEPSYFAAISSVDQAKFTTTMCGSAEEKTGFANMSYWLFVMLTGLFMHLPGIGGGWANLNKYTGLMTVIDNSLTNGVPAGKKTMM